MGYYLAPLPGLVAPVSASPKYKVLTDSFDWRARLRSKGGLTSPAGESSLKLVGVSMSSYLASRGCWRAGIGACAMAAFAAWAALGWLPALIVSVPLGAAGLALCYLGLRPPIELCADHLQIGRRTIRWADIRRVDRLYSRFPLLIRLRLTTGRRVFLVFCGDRDSANSLLRNIRRMAKAAFIEGRPYREFWGEALPPSKSAGAWLHSAAACCSLKTRPKSSGCTSN